MPISAKKRVVDRHGGAAGEQEAGAARHAEHAERADEGRHPQARDQQAVDGAGHAGGQHARPEAEQHGQRQAGDRRSRRCMTWAATTAARPMTKPTERSMPPEMMTKVWPGRQQQRHHREDGDALQVEGVEEEGAAEGDAAPRSRRRRSARQEQPGAQVGDALDDGLGAVGVVGLRLGVRVARPVTVGVSWAHLRRRGVSDGSADGGEVARRQRRGAGVAISRSRRTSRRSGSSILSLS